MNNKKKVYISLPIACSENTVCSRYMRSIIELGLHDELKNYEICGPVNIDEFTAEGLKNNREHTYSWYMGRDIERLLECDAIYMSHGWVSSKGCAAELEVAKVYGIKVYYADELKNIKFD